MLKVYTNWWESSDEPTKLVGDEIRQNECIFPIKMFYENSIRHILREFLIRIWRFVRYEMMAV